MGVSSSESHDLTAFYEMLSARFGVLSQNTGFYPSLDRIIETMLRPLNLGPGGGSYNEPISRLQCPDIAFSITKLSQYLANPGDDHWTVINHLLWYLSSTRDLKLTYDGNSKCDDESGYSDSDWAGDPRDHRSISGYIFTMAGAAVSWSSKKQPSVALSSTEGEYMAMTHASKEAIWIQQFLHDIHFPLSDPTTLLVDNQGAIALASNL